MRLRLLGEIKEVRRVPLSELLGLARLFEPLGRVLADRLEHPVAGADLRVALAQEALVEERLQGVGVGAGDLLGGLVACSRRRRRRGGRRAAARPLRGGRTTTRSSRAGSAGGDRRRARPSAGRAAARACSSSCSGLKRAVRAAASSSASGSSSRRRQSSRTASLGAKPGSTARARAMKSATPSDSASGGTGYVCSPPTRRRSRLVTRTSRLGQALTSVGELGRRLHDLLEVVEEAEHRLVGDVLGEAVLRAERLRCGLEDELGVAQGRERHPPDPVRVGVGCAQPAACRASRVFPVPPGPVRVSRRASSAARSSTTSASSRSLPRKGVAGTGRFVR